MPWIKVIEEAEADATLRAAYAQVKGARGKVANILAVHSLNPQALADHMALYTHLMFGHNGLTRAEREMLAVTVSATNRCAYCIEHHAEALLHYWKDRERIACFVEDFRTAALSPRELAMLEYAQQLTREPAAITAAAVEQLRAQGFTDEEILNINLIVSYFNFVNRIALGLGVEFSADEVSGYKY